MSAERQAEFEARTKAQSELRRAAAEITRLRATLEYIAAITPNELSSNHQYSRGWNDARWRLKQIASAALSPTPETGDTA